MTLTKDSPYDQEKKWHVVSLNDNVATLMAISNDDSYDKVFSKQLEGNITKMTFFLRFLEAEIQKI